MKKLYLLFLLLQTMLFAQSHSPSNVSLPKVYIQNLDPYPCAEYCRQDYIDSGMIFSFLSHANVQLEDEAQDEVRKMNISILNLGSHSVSNKLRIALLLPYKTIGRYAASTTNATFAYLIAKNHSFELKSYKIESENIEDIQEALIQIEEDGFGYVIAPLTQKGAMAVEKISPYLSIYFPTINKKDMSSTSQYLIYGGIDYQAQIDMLLKEAVSPLVIFQDRSKTGTKLTLYQEEKFMSMDINETNTTALKADNGLVVLTPDEEIEDEETKEPKSVVKFSIPRRTTNLEDQLSQNAKISRGSFFINTTIVKTGMIMSQLTLYDANVTNILSTQINYNPLMLSMTQYEDRKNMIVANSIAKNSNILIETNKLLSNDIVYDWINYTTTVGVDYFFSLATNKNREYDIPLDDNQMTYPIELLNPSKYRFIEHITTKEDS